MPHRKVVSNRVQIIYINLLLHRNYRVAFSWISYFLDTIPNVIKNFIHCENLCPCDCA